MPTFVAVRAASTGNINITTPIASPIDGVALFYNDYILLKDQTNPVQNGIYLVGIGPGATRAPGFDASIMQFSGLSVVVNQGQTNSNSQWSCTTDLSKTLGTTAPIQFGQISGNEVEKIPQGLDPSGTSDCRDIIQRCIDSLVRYNNKREYSGVDEETASFTLKFNTGMDNTLIRVRPSTAGATVVVTLPNIAPTDTNPQAIVALMGDGIVKFQVTGGATLTNRLYGTSSPPSIKARFQAVLVKMDRTILNVNYVLTESPPTGGGTCRLPSGTYKIKDNGLKLHPAVNLIGDNLGSTELVADAAMTGAEDNGLSDPALLTICARAPSSGSSSKDMFQPVVQNLKLSGGNLTTQHIHGLLLEAGNLDPYFPTSGSSDYSGSSGTLLNVGIYSFTGLGIFSQADRQRFYCEALRVLFNKDGGLQLLGNDAVIGPRTGIGSNGSPSPRGGNQIQVSGCSGLLMTGVNVFSGGANRAINCLAMNLSNINGATITGCVFNDTISIDGGSTKTFIDTGISIVGCDFNPNSSVFSADGDPVGTGVGAPAIHRT
jgi:hypothetical protein